VAGQGVAEPGAADENQRSARGNQGAAALEGAAVLKSRPGGQPDSNQGQDASHRRLDSTLSERRHQAPLAGFCLLKGGSNSRIHNTGNRQSIPRSVWIGLLLSVLLVASACGGPPVRLVPPEPTPNPQLTLSAPVAKARADAQGAPVDCSVDLQNRSGRTVTRAVVTCELLGADGLPVGAGLGTAQNLANGDHQTVRSVVFGVRVFASARAVVTQAAFQ
jgi:hypothetical protein